MSKAKVNKNFRAFLLIAIFAVVIYLIIRNIGVFGHILLVALGFGAVVLVHEFGHFIVAKLSGIKVEAFSIFMPPILLGVRKTGDGFRFRILPKFFPKENDQEGDGQLSFTVGRGGKAGETEYRIGLIPFGGFVKMLGQEDTKEVERSDDPRSYANKPVGVRMAVIAAGVFFNALSAILIFMTVFLVGIRFSPPVVGFVVPDSPAERVGLKSGDEIIAIDGKSDDLDFSSIAIAAVLSDKDEEIVLKVRHPDGCVEDFPIVAEQLPGQQRRGFGILPPMSLTIAEVSDVNTLFEKTGLLPGDRILAVNGTDVEQYWQMQEVFRNSLVPAVTVLSERMENGKVKLVKSQIRLNLSPANKEVKSESELSHIYSIVPRLRIEAVSKKPPSIQKHRCFKERLMSLVSGKKKDKDIDTRGELQSGDIILAVGDVKNPTFKELRDVTEQYADTELPVRVLRTDANGVEKTLTITVVPKRRKKEGRALIGIGVALDADHPVVAKTISTEAGPVKLAIPRGAVITAVDGVSVSNFYDIIKQIRENVGEPHPSEEQGEPFDSAQDRHVTIDYHLDEEIAGDVVLDVGTGGEFVAVKSAFVDFVPFEQMRRLYKAGGPVRAIVMGYKRTVMFIAQTYLTLKCWASGLVSPKSLVGPVGILAISYTIVARQPLVYYFYFLGLISACIAVVNFLPLLPLDGGHVVFLLVEKIKGSAISEQVQGAIASVGWVLIAAFFLYLTFNDIVNHLFL